MLLVVLCLVLAFPHPKTVEAEVNVGVKVGDYVEYAVNVTGVPEYAGLGTINVTVVKVDGTVVTQLIIFIYKNGTTTTETRTVDVSTQADFVTSANLNIGDSRVVPPPGGNITVTKILTKNYYGVDREVCFFNQTTTGRKFISYYDRKTGFLLESYYELSYFNVKAQLAYSLHSTNLWPAPPKSIFEWLKEKIMENYIYVIGFIVALVIIIIIIISILIKRQKKANIHGDVKSLKIKWNILP